MPINCYIITNIGKNNISGLCVEDHGFVGNHMWDEATGDRFSLGQTPESYNRHWWEFAEPLYVTAAKQVI